MIFGMGRKICPFFWIIIMIVEFLTAVDVADVTPAFRADGEFGIIVSGNGRIIPFGIRIKEEGNQAVPVEFIPGRQIAQFQ